MRITILANRDLPSNYALNLLMKLLDAHELTVFLSDRVGKKSDKHPSLQNLEFFEHALFLKILYPLVSRHKRKLLSFNEMGQEFGCSIDSLNGINAGTEFNQFVETKPDLVITLRYGVILKEQVISIPKFGVINLHSGILPDYKGVMATFRAMLNKENTIGTTLHYITDSSIDEGPVIGTTEFVVNPKKSYLWHVINLYTEGCKLIESAVRTIGRDGRIDAGDQLPGGRYYSFPMDAELLAFDQLGLKLFDGDEIMELVSQHFIIDRREPK
jgi:methionyl-tRNA formyltransferase